MPNDGQRPSFIKLLVEEGYADSVVIAHDMFGKHRQVRFGGHGFAHILENIGPRLEEGGLSDEEVSAILVGNPARILTVGIGAVAPYSGYGSCAAMPGPRI